MPRRPHRPAARLSTAAASVSGSKGLVRSGAGGMRAAAHRGVISTASTSSSARARAVSAASPALTERSTPTPMIRLSSTTCCTRPRSCRARSASSSVARARTIAASVCRRAEPREVQRAETGHSADRMQLRAEQVGRLAGQGAEDRHEQPVFAAVAAGEEGRLRHHLDRRADADARPGGGDRLADARRPVGRAEQVQAEALAPARLRQQRPRRVRFCRRHRPIGDGAEDEGRHRLVGGIGVALHDLPGDALPVQRQRHRAADPDVPHRVAARPHPRLAAMSRSTSG